MDLGPLRSLVMVETDRGRPGIGVCKTRTLGPDWGAYEHCKSLGVLSGDVGDGRRAVRGA
ncbi:hypothetical protein EEJ42_05610 [Streptomyces botrytidirepellens]|uniref:Uncharacterized protein n=1 Tax=Streptomyces botrytidirepellens TaxID=2486417 RepID=A0A3M8WW12_9ACTN|nr:hypothetical protein EEJ42_05610 [Streptomyces botrytidirepellens]